MTTIINTPGNSESTDSGAGWAVAVIVLLAVIAGGVYFWSHYRYAAPARTGGANINVTIPQGTSGSPQQ